MAQLGNRHRRAQAQRARRRPQPEDRPYHEATRPDERGETRHIQRKLQDVALREAAQGRGRNASHQARPVAELDLDAIDFGIDGDGCEAGDVLPHQQHAIDDQPLGELVWTEDFGLEGEAEQARQSRPLGGSLDLHQQGIHSGDEPRIAVRQFVG
jgi:hypothetical protein